MNYLLYGAGMALLLAVYALGIFSGGGSIGDNKVFNITVEIHGEIIDPENLDPLLHLFNKLP